MEGREVEFVSAVGDLHLGVEDRVERSPLGSARDTDGLGNVC